MRPLNSEIDWRRIDGLVALSDEELRIVGLLASGEGLTNIGKVLGQHRSMVWRKIEQIKARLPGAPPTKA